MSLQSIDWILVLFTVSCVVAVAFVVQLYRQDIEYLSKADKQEKLLRAILMEKVTWALWVGMLFAWMIIVFFVIPELFAYLTETAIYRAVIVLAFASINLMHPLLISAYRREIYNATD